MAITTGMYQQMAPAPNLAEAYGRGRTMGQMIRKGDRQEQEYENKMKMRDIMSGALKSGDIESLYDPTTLGKIAEYSPETTMGLMQSKAKQDAQTRQMEQKSEDRRSRQDYRSKTLGIQQQKIEQASGQQKATQKHRDSILRLREKEINTKMKRAQSRAKEFEHILSPAEKKVDQNYAKEYVDWQTQGGFATVQRNIADAKNVIADLYSKKDTTSGPLAGLFADTWIQDVVNPGAADVQDRINRIIMGSLRATLGAQFTEKEGQRVLQATYNPRQDEKVNARRIQGLLTELETASQAKESSAKHFEKYGTMKGYTGPKFETDGILGKGGGYNPGDIVTYKGKKYKVGDDSDTLLPIR